MNSSVIDGILVSSEGCWKECGIYIFLVGDDHGVIGTRLLCDGIEVSA